MSTMATYESIINDWEKETYCKSYWRKGYPYTDYEFYCLLLLRNQILEGKGQTTEEACKDIYEQVRETLWIHLKKLYEHHGNL